MRHRLKKEPTQRQGQPDARAAGRHVLLAAGDSEWQLSAAQARALAAALTRAAESAEEAAKAPVPAPPRPIPEVQAPPPQRDDTEAVELGDGVSVLRRAAAHARQFDTDAIITAVLHPDDMWLSPLDTDRPALERRRIHIAAEIGVVLPPSPSQLVLSVMTADRLYDQRRREGSRDSGYRRPAAGAAPPMPESTTELVEALLQHGFESKIAGSGHYKLTHPQHPGTSAVLAATASDYRAAANSVATIRKVFGFDVRTGTWTAPEAERTGERV